MRDKSPFSVGNLTVGTASKWRLGVLAAAVRGILAVRAPALVRSAGPGAIPGKINEGGSIGGVEQGAMRPHHGVNRCSRTVPLPLLTVFIDRVLALYSPRCL